MTFLHYSCKIWSKFRVAVKENYKLFVIKPVLLLYMLQYSIGSTVSDQVGEGYVLFGVIAKNRMIFDTTNPLNRIALPF